MCIDFQFSVRVRGGDDSKLTRIEKERRFPRGLQRTIGPLSHERKHDAEKSSSQETHGGAAHKVGLVRKRGSPGGVYDAAVAGPHGRGDAVFLDFLQQVLI